jgi:mannitol-1-/sugar-/sorbitol-6-phosphatase
MTSRAPRPLADYGAVLVDLDGTLVNSDGAVRRAWTSFAHRHGLDVETVLHVAQGRPSRETARKLAPGAPDEPGLLEDAEATDTDGIVAFPGAAELLAARLTLALVTSCTRRLATVRLTAAGLPIPAVAITADDVTRGKPDPEPYLTAARALNVDPADCVVLEDAPAGIAAGRAAGMTVIALRTTHGDDELDGADAVVADLAALSI